MSNYIPVLDDALSFCRGLVIFGVGIGLQVVFSMSAMFKVGEEISGQGRDSLRIKLRGDWCLCRLGGIIYLVIRISLPTQLAQ